MMKIYPALLGLGMATLSTVATAYTDQTPTSATAITQVFGDGVKMTAVALVYDEAIDQSQLSVADFQVANRTIKAVYPSQELDLTAEKSGRFVVIELDVNDKNTSLEQRIDMPNATVQDKPKGGTPWVAGDKLSKNIWYQNPKATITIQGDNPITISTTQTKNLIVDDFRQYVFKDPKTGRDLRFNLFVPKDIAKPLPLVVFMHDAGTTSEQTQATLFQGLGAVIWADPAEQSRRPAIVLAPQYDEIIVDDHWGVSPLMDTTINLIEHLKATYPIDHKRIYATGQSGGGMMTMAMNIKYPDYFTASYIVASKWGEHLVAPMAKNKLWIMASVDDIGAFPSQNAITKTLQQHNASVARASWNAKWNKDEYRFFYDKLTSEPSNVKYTVFEKGTVFKDGDTAQTASGHRNTWRVAYSIEPIREWLFEQSK